MIEFSLIAFPFLFLLLATFEIGFVYWATDELDNAANDAARLVRTGQVQTGKLNQAQLKAQICSKTTVLLDCETKLRLDLRSAGTFAGITPPDPVGSNGALKGDGDFTFSPGDGNDVILLSAFYNWSSFLLTGDYLLRAAMPARNEPF